MNKKITGYQVFSFFNILIMLLITFVTFYPIYYVVVASFSDPGALSRTYGPLWYPLKPFTLDAYKMVFRNAGILTGYPNTLFILVVGVTINLTMTVLGAFFLTIKGPMLQNGIVKMIIFTMYFSGGMVPIYLNIRDLGLLNSLWSLILPTAISTSNLIIMKAAFQGIPDSLVESALLDGASYYKILWKIMVPLSKATMAVMVLYYGVGHWNSWFDASIYLQDSKKFPLQLVLRNILVLSQMQSMAAEVDAVEMTQFVELVKYALIVVASLPILIVYPFLQKYFTKGVMIGAIKG